MKNVNVKIYNERSGELEKIVSAVEISRRKVKSLAYQLWGQMSEIVKVKLESGKEIEVHVKCITDLPVT